MHEKLVYPKKCVARIVQVRVKVPENLLFGKSIDIEGKNKYVSEPTPIIAKRGLLGISYTCKKVECPNHANHQE